MKKIAFIGSRTWQDAQRVALAVNAAYELHGRFILVSGGAGGASAVAEATAHEFGFPVISFRPVKIGGDLTHEDSYGVDEWRLHRGTGKIVKHYEPAWANYASAAHYRSLLIVERCDEAQVFWDGTSPGTSFEIDMLKAQDVPYELHSVGDPDETEYVAEWLVGV